MPSLSRPELLDFNEGLADAADADFAPPTGESWEAHSVVVSGSVDIKRIFDPGETGTLGNAIPITSLDAPGELHAAKFELHAGSTAPTSGLRITNTSGGSINVYLYGVRITP